MISEEARRISQDVQITIIVYICQYDILGQSADDGFFPVCCTVNTTVITKSTGHQYIIRFFYIFHVVQTEQI